MKESTPPRNEAASALKLHLLERIQAMRASVGDCLNDDEFTRLLRETALPTECGFGFLSYSDRFVTLGVPLQNLDDWYPQAGWITAAKEQAARDLASKHGLALYEPPDRTANWGYLTGGPVREHHHLELASPSETVIIAHPQYLKIRLFGTTPSARYLPTLLIPLLHQPELLQDLATLYINAHAQPRP